MGVRFGSRGRKVAFPDVLTKGGDLICEYQIDRAPSKAGTCHPGAHVSGVAASQFHQKIQFARADLVVVSQTLV
jgi:hypothetical protein